MTSIVKCCAKTFTRLEYLDIIYQTRVLVVQWLLHIRTLCIIYNMFIYSTIKYISYLSYSSPLAAILTVSQRQRILLITSFVILVWLFLLLIMTVVRLIWYESCTFAFGRFSSLLKRLVSMLCFAFSLHATFLHFSLVSINQYLLFW